MTEPKGLAFPTPVPLLWILLTTLEMEPIKTTQDLQTPIPLPSTQPMEIAPVQTPVMNKMLLYREQSAIKELFPDQR